MLEAVCAYIHNYFEDTIYTGTFTIKDGAPYDFPKMITGTRFRIMGSLLNDGVYTFATSAIWDDDAEKEVRLQDETFKGRIVIMRVPQRLIRLVKEDMAEYQQKYGKVESPYTSESFGGYSYTKASGGSDSGGSADIFTVFHRRLNEWRKIG